ncbi:hypothetical protein PHYBLDRAFT_171928 [Phycomyces blakesleeanus NRRL 1555(-)]|uniref:Uncharacterized protein n=1 Tax=Phycomyces blakesleeanus (strain ATCC 8743b / DSM 1359 / FGSC 10004 / NBRC 33097 / NRRL 1555) TaxID=763407 RepID=A0A162PL21_PHYB8|nr:hypothetical protein PHYBLDRAFT_171928 [Phycomyces blakesleeanus NRRL 1555(-)]OAD69906.1 hypothetical protein PHYBLDRAFT_171928 [Phycomyces blakesleeanus NRRL 1555(-)]|eukprot:XP_018287946.1 hypothetical protein PHYBLDRAFT_171928 [Phycomyces blakesleeanus NRRL 1555(-)]
MSWSSTGLMFLRYTQGIDLYGNYVTCNFQNDKKRMYFVDGNTYDATYVETLSATHNSFSERMFTTTSHLGVSLSLALPRYTQRSAAIASTPAFTVKARYSDNFLENLGPCLLIITIFRYSDSDKI